MLPSSLFTVGWAVASLFVSGSLARVDLTQDDTCIVLQNDRLFASLNKTDGAIHQVFLDGQDLLGPQNGLLGLMYTDCYCTPKGYWMPGSMTPQYEVYSGVDSTGTCYVGVKMSDTYTLSGQMLEQYWFLRDGETGLHSFSRVAYYNETTPFLRNLQEFRSIFRPNSELWTHLMTNEQTYGPMARPANRLQQVVVQDATWYFGNTPNDPYVEEVADYFTKYTFADTYRHSKVHGLFADGSYTPDNSTFGSWLVRNTLETYHGGPLHSDLTVDGWIYDYIVSNHRGASTPNITNGYDRTFGPQFFYFNHFPPGTDIMTSRADAAQYADPEWNIAFYDSIAKHVPNYVTSQQRGAFRAQISVPHYAKNPIVVLSENGVDFQDNVHDWKAYQYWAEIDKHGHAMIPRVKAGTYRVTVYADGLFGQFVQDNVVVTAGRTKHFPALWQEESSGWELFRIGTPDKSSGEYRHGYARDPNHPRHFEEYRIYWPVYDFVNEFPDGVVFQVGKSDPSTELNYVHWSVFGGTGNSLRPEPYVGNGNVNNWTIQFDFSDLSPQKPAYYPGPGPAPGPLFLPQGPLPWPGLTENKATFTVQLAGAKTAAGNTDVYNSTLTSLNLKYSITVNGHDIEPWIIPYYQSSSCAVRSGVICYNIAHKFVFPASLLHGQGQNEIVLSLPFNASDWESAVLPGATYVQYDAMRLEIA